MCVYIYIHIVYLLINQSYRGGVMSIYSVCMGNVVIFIILIRYQVLGFIGVVQCRMRRKLRMIMYKNGRMPHDAQKT